MKMPTLSRTKTAAKKKRRRKNGYISRTGVYRKPWGISNERERGEGISRKRRKNPAGEGGKGGGEDMVGIKRRR